MRIILCIISGKYNLLASGMLGRAVMLGLRVALKASGGRTRDRTLQGPPRSGGPTGHVHRPLPGAPPPGLHPGHHRPHGLLHPGHHRGVWLPRVGQHSEAPPGPQGQVRAGYREPHTTGARADALLLLARIFLDLRLSL